MAEVNLDVAMESTSQEILSNLQETSLNVVGLMNAGSTIPCSASNNVMLTVIGSEKVYTSDQTIAQYKVNKMNGTLRMTASAKTKDTYYGRFKISSTSGGTKEFGFDQQSYSTKSVDITVADGDIIKITFERGFSTTYVNLLTLCADLSEPVSPVPGLSVIK